MPLEACDQWCIAGIDIGTFSVFPHITDLDVNIRNMIRKFADDITIGGVIDNKECGFSLQTNYDQLGRTGEQWCM